MSNFRLDVLALERCQTIVNFEGAKICLECSKFSDNQYHSEISSIVEPHFALNAM